MLIYLKEENIKTVGDVIITNYKALPDTFDDFVQFFVDPINSELKETDIFKRRIFGLTSYFRSASESLLPRYAETPEFLHIDKIPMSNYQIGIYESAEKLKEMKKNEMLKNLNEMLT